MSFTTSHTFTLSNAAYVGSKVATDLKIMQILFGQPTDEWIEKYKKEMAELLFGGYLKTVTYGFKKGTNWIVAVRYEAQLDGTLSVDDRAGRLIGLAGTDVSGASHSSYLIYSDKWHRLSATTRAEIEQRIGFSRVGTAEPGTGVGYWATEKTYSANGTGVMRSTLTRY